MAVQPELSFAGLLRQLRAEARLTQEELAEAAGISPRSVSDLERASTAAPIRTPAALLARLAGRRGLAGGGAGSVGRSPGCAAICRWRLG